VIINELFENIDAYRLSTYLYKDSSKIHIGPIWDFNFSLGLTKPNKGKGYPGLVYKNEAVSFWWNILMSDREFKAKLKNRWINLRKTHLTTENIEQIIDDNKIALGKDIDLNNQKWLIFVSSSEFRNFDSKSYNQEIIYIKYWLNKRLIYLDEQFINNN
jgi:hypothetical protein